MSNIASLPKWAQAHIDKLEREARDAKAVLDRTLGAQEPTPVYCEDHRSGGRRLYSKVADSGQFSIEWEGVKVHVILRKRSGEIDFSYSTPGRGLETVNFVPSSTQQFKLRRAINEVELQRAAEYLAQAAMEIPSALRHLPPSPSDGIFRDTLKERVNDLEFALHNFRKQQL